jgi:NADH:ubiquinone oxidoreductase subunit K
MKRLLGWIFLLLSVALFVSGIYLLISQPNKMTLGSWELLIICAIIAFLSLRWAFPKKKDMFSNK